MTQSIVDSHNEIKKSSKPPQDEVMTPVLLADYLGVCKNTVYNYLQRGLFPSVRSAGKTFVRKSDVDKLFDSAPPYQKRKPGTNSPTSGSQKIEAAESSSGYTTVKEVAEKYSLSLAGTDRILKDSGITVVKHKGKHYYPVSEVQALFRKREAASHPEISEWYTSAEVQEKFSLKPASVWDIVSKYRIPSKKVHNVTYYSKIHFDMARGIKPLDDTLWYTVDQAMEKYTQTRDQVYNVLRYNNIERVQQGRYVKFRRKDYDEAMKYVVRP